MPATTATNRRNDFQNSARWEIACPNQITAAPIHVSKNASGAPARNWQAPVKMAVNSDRPPRVQACSTRSKTHGIQLSAALLLGHIRQCNARPLEAKTIPAKAAAKFESVQRRARKNIPSPPNQRCSRQNTFNDHGNGKRR